MKKRFNEEYKVVRADCFDELKFDETLPFPFEKELLNLLKKENKFKQEYYYIKKNQDFAFFTVYKNKMNVFTFGKANLFVNINVIGFPCSLSNPGYVTNNEEMLFDYITRMPGAKLVLNVNRNNISNKYIVGNTLPTCIMKINFKDVEEYLSSQRSSYRRRIKAAIKSCEDIKVIEDTDSQFNVHKLYLNTYQKSDYKLEKLEKGFFDSIDATKIVFIKEEHPIGFVLLKKIEKKLTFMLCGMDYNHDTTDLYYYMLYKIVEFAVNNECSEIDFGQTSEETKLKMGASLKEKYFYAHHSNVILNCIVKMCKGLLEYKYKFPLYRVFKEQKNESIVDKTRI